MASTRQICLLLIHSTLGIIFNSYILSFWMNKDRWNMLYLLFVFFSRAISLTKMRLIHFQGLDQLVFMLIWGLASVVAGQAEQSVSQHTEDVKGNLISGRDFRVTIDK
jgi:hypothetical protein